ncbi:MAG: hypothetical protein IPP48_15130 [Chitinophagaceae bacterium]|nr:hypothetical protein [Chitinophagaceae bacterium]
MKKVYFLLLLVLGSMGVWGQVLTENFSYTAGQPITANGWTAHNAAGTNAITVTSPGLTYAGHPGSGVGNAVTMTTTGEDDNKALSSAITTGSAYTSFLVNVSAAQATGDYFVGLLATTSTFPIRIYAKSTTGGFSLGLVRMALQESVMKQL